MTRVRLMLDDEVLDWFRAVVNRAGGGHYPTLINAALREHIARESNLERVLRRVLREELRNSLTSGRSFRRPIRGKTRNHSPTQ